MPIPQYKITVIGVGLIGGSIAKALKSLGHTIICVDPDTETLQYAQANGFGDLFTSTVEEVSASDFVFVATPINHIQPVIEKISHLVPENCCITDVGSTKSDILRYVNELPHTCSFIGGHPMAGTAHNGIEFSKADMFYGAKWILCPTNKGIDAQVLKNFKYLLVSMGAEPVEMDHETHDKAVAITIGLPYLVSYSIYSLVQSLEDKGFQDYVKLLAATGFRDSTRLATTNPELGQFLLKLNQQEYLDKFIQYFKALSSMENPVDILRSIAADRGQLYSLDGHNIFKLGS